MQKVYIYKTKDGTSFDLQKDAFRHERKTILQEMFSSIAMPQEERSRMIENILHKFDDIIEAFEDAEVMTADEGND